MLLDSAQKMALEKACIFLIFCERLKFLPNKKNYVYKEKKTFVTAQKN